VAGRPAGVAAGGLAAVVHGGPAGRCRGRAVGRDRCHRVLVTAGQSLDAARLSGPGGRLGAAAGRAQRPAAGRAPPGHRRGRRAARRRAAGRRAGPTGAVTWAEWVLAARAEVLGADHRGTIAARAGLGRALTAAGRSPGRGHGLGGGSPGQRAGLGRVTTTPPCQRQRITPRPASRPGSRAIAVRLLKRSAPPDGRKPGGRTTRSRWPPGSGWPPRWLAAGSPGTRPGSTRSSWPAASSPPARNHPDTLAAAAPAGRGRAAPPGSWARRCGTTAGSRRVRAVPGPGHPVTLGCQGGLARACYDAGHAGDAVTLRRAANRRRRAVPVPGRPGDSRAARPAGGHYQ